MFNGLRRTTDVQKIVELDAAHTDSIKIDVYDNGEIDGDAISVYLNDSVLIKNTILSQKALSFFISLNKNLQFQKLKMVAENLGSIPPNTALMIISIRNNRVTLNLSSDYAKNATVEFVLKKQTF